MTEHTIITNLTDNETHVCMFDTDDDPPPKLRVGVVLELTDLQISICKAYALRYNRRHKMTRLVLKIGECGGPTSEAVEKEELDIMAITRSMF